MPVQRLILLPALVFSGLIVGCSAWSTYPPIEHTAGLVSPANPPVPELMADAIGYVNEQFGGGAETYAVNLPTGVPAAVYEKVFERLEGAAHPLTDPTELAYHVIQVRSRGTEGEVDVIYPRADGLHQLVTVRLGNNLFSGFTVESVKQWRVRAEPPAPAYVAPAEPEAIVEAPTDHAGD